ncbi:hypothetical protein AMS68_004954 [Peltaster fructicola]|uniref:Zn(2)-C6 fungal-type domain-containing protein n=1 Tax=Peltaster fructicola TaxID=286661 RepID=A0A6H0XXD6_9PEZI|nr:hypothetical protein AMS68_004954 [Peltaster fructicola]
MSQEPVDSSTADLGEGPERKRRRKVLSCWDCRRRKLQCDRALPACGRCTKAGKAGNCLYIDDAGGETSTITATSTRTEPSDHRADINTQLDSKDRRIRELEIALAQSERSHAMVALREHRFPLTPESTMGNNNVAATAMDRESMVLRGRGFKTKYFGSTHPGAIMGFIPSLSSITKDAFEKYPALGQMRSDIHALEERIGDDDAAVSQTRDQDLQSLMPPKIDADELVHLYVDTFENIYHMLHLPTFWKAYEEMWTGTAVTSPHFIAIVLLMMACVSCLSSQPQRYVAQSSTSRNRALHWIRHCEDWISRQSQKHVTAADFQIRCLLWLGRQTSARRIKRAWTDAGSVLRFCMSAGLHRNPDLLQKETSALDKELRRRIWATAVDFELQASFDRGMVSAPWLLQSDSPGPANLQDEDFASSRKPTPRPLHDFTPSSYLAQANDSLMLRSTLNAVLNNIRQSLTFDEVKHYTEEIEAHIANIPAWTDRRSDVPKALLSLRLQQYLLVLHDRHLRQANTSTECNFSKAVVLETALKIVETHKMLVAKGSLALTLYCLDPLRIAVSTAHLQSFIDPKMDLALSRSFDTLTPQLMEDVIKLIQDKFYRFGRDDSYGSH